MGKEKVRERNAGLNDEGRGELERECGPSILLFYILFYIT